MFCVPIIIHPLFLFLKIETEEVALPTMCSTQLTNLATEAESLLSVYGNRLRGRIADFVISALLNQMKTPNSKRKAFVINFLKRFSLIPQRISSSICTYNIFGSVSSAS